MNTEKFLDWLVELNVQHYKTEKSGDYIPSGPSHFYLSGSPERFTSTEMIAIYSNKANDELNERWLFAVADHASWKLRH